MLMTGQVDIRGRRKGATLIPLLSAVCLALAMQSGLAGSAGAAMAEDEAGLSGSEEAASAALTLRWSEADFRDLAAAMSESYTHGLPDLSGRIDAILDPGRPEAERRRDAERIFLLYAGWLRFGMLEGEALTPRRLSRDERAEIESALISGLEEGDLYSALAGLAPPVADYDALRMEMARLSAFQPIWPQIQPGPALRRGDRGARVDQLRARLAAEGLLTGAARASDRPGAAYDLRLETAVRRFQGRVNLAPTGVVDRDTLAQLNITPQRRLAQLRANLEQRRWRSRDLGRRHIWVNLADFTLEAWEDGRLARRHIVMVGREASSTPEFTEDMQYLVLNPWWNIPAPSGEVRFRSIRRNPSLVDQHGFRVIHASTGQAVSVWEMDWTHWGTSAWPYRLAQAPGGDNPMGEVKFIFPNRYNVYIHDTVERDQFVRTRRDFSAGCIRVQDPFALAAWVLAEQDEPWSLADVEAVAAGDQARVVWLDQRMPVHLSYWTVVGDEAGEVRYLNDLYDRDDPVIAAVASAHAALSRGEPAFAPSPNALPVESGALD